MSKQHRKGFKDLVFKFTRAQEGKHEESYNLEGLSVLTQILSFLWKVRVLEFLNIWRSDTLGARLSPNFFGESLVPRVAIWWPSLLKAASYEKNSCNATVSSCLGKFILSLELQQTFWHAGTLLKLVGRFLVCSLLSRHIIRQSMEICSWRLSFDANALEPLEKRLPCPGRSLRDLIKLLSSYELYHSACVAFERDFVFLSPFLK